MRPSAFGLLLGVCLVAALAFLLLPIAALFTEVPLRRVPGLLDRAAVRDALRVTLVTNALANVCFLVVGTPAAYLLATRRFRGRALLVSLLELPLVLPPAVAGVGLLAALAPTGLLGGTLDALGLRLPLTRVAVTLAVLFVATPYYLRQAVAAFEAVDRRYLDAARTLGASPARTFARVALPLAAGGLAAGWALAFARGVGEFGATILFAGNIPGVTQTVSLAIYEQLDLSFDVALALGVLLVVLSALVLVVAKLAPSRVRRPPLVPPA